jgi:serine/threonine-protein phosphatase 4 regulatory subunit 1
MIVLCLAVLHTLGRERWPELNDLYDHLVKDLQWKVRKTLSFSLHEVAKILGTELTEKCLLSTFELFFKDLDEVCCLHVSLSCFITSVDF